MNLASLVTLGAIAFTAQGLIQFLIVLIILCVVIYAISVVLGMIQLPPPVKSLVWLVIAVIVLVFLLSYLGQAL